MYADHTPESLGDNSQKKSLSLVEIEPGLAVLFGDGHIPELEVVSFDLLGEHNAKRLKDRLAQGAGLLNLLAQFGQSLSSAQGLVRLSPETMSALKTSIPLTSGGYNLGTLVGADGKFAHSVRWSSGFGVTQGAQVSPAMAQASVLMALTVQLVDISRRVDQNIGLTKGIAKQIHDDQWATLVSLCEATQHAIMEANKVKAVNRYIFEPLTAKEADLRKQRILFTNMVEEHLKALDLSVTDRRKYVRTNFERVIADIHGMVMAEGAWYRTQVLRAAYICHEDYESHENQKLVAELVENTKREHERAMEKLKHLLSEVERQCQLMTVLPDEFTLPFTTKRRDSHLALEMVRAMSEKVANIQNMELTVRAEISPVISAFEDGIPDSLLSILKWALPTGQELLALADINHVSSWWGSNSFLGITQQSFFIAPYSSVLKEGDLGSLIPLSDIRYVRFKVESDDNPRIDIITKDENFDISFDKWARTQSGLDKVSAVANLLIAAMNLPESECRIDPLLPQADRLQPDQITGM
ncbi:MAG: hypothetical protein Q4P66_01935 [Actinomycetaceae bacterium]|nr:hypothetical protein [Actinomycetaceae bacterium]